MTVSPPLHLLTLRRAHVLFSGPHLCSCFRLHRCDWVFRGPYSNMERCRYIKLADVLDGYLDRRVPYSELHSSICTPCPHGSWSVGIKRPFSLFCFIDVRINGTRGPSSCLGISECNGKSGSDIWSLFVSLIGQSSVHHGVWRDLRSPWIWSGCIHCDAYHGQKIVRLKRACMWKSENSEGGPWLMYIPSTLLANRQPAILEKIYS